MSTPAPDPALRIPEDPGSYRLATEAIRRRIGLADAPRQDARSPQDA